MRDENDIPSGDLFTALVASRVEKHQRKRKTVFIAGALLSLIAVFSGYALLPAQDFAVEVPGIGEIFTTLMLAAICAIAAMATESGS